MSMEAEIIMTICQEINSKLVKENQFPQLPVNKCRSIKFNLFAAKYILNFVSVFLFTFCFFVKQKRKIIIEIYSFK